MDATDHVRTWLLLAALGTTSLLTAQASAQTGQQDAALTLQAAMDRAVAANLAVQAARMARAVDRAGLAVAAERPNPEATVEVEKETPKQAYGVALPLELGGKRAKRLAVGQAAIEAGEAELAAIIVRIRNDVRRAYFDVLVADARLGVLSELRELSQRVRNTAQTRFDAGDVPRLEVLQAELALAAADNDATAAEGVAAAARTRLNALLDRPLDTRQALSTPLEAVEPIDTTATLNVARTANADLTVLDRQIAEQQTRLTLARALRVPDVTPAATFTRDAEPEFSYGWRAGIAVTLPIFTTHKAGVLVEQSVLDQLVAQRAALLARVTGDVTAAAALAESLRLTFVRYRDVLLPQAQQVEQLAQDSYQLGQTGIAALLQALQASRDVRLRSLDAIAQFQSARGDLELAVGAALP